MTKLQKVKMFLIKYVVPVFKPVSVWYLTKLGYKVEAPKIENKVK